MHGLRLRAISILWFRNLYLNLLLFDSSEITFGETKSWSYKRVYRFSRITTKCIFEIFKAITDKQIDGYGMITPPPPFIPKLQKLFFFFGGPNQIELVDHQDFRRLILNNANDNIVL